MSTLSFHATKTYNTVEGGALVCHDEETKKEIDYLKNFGFADELTVVAPGINSKMDELRAAYGLIGLKYIDHAINIRKSVAMKYRSLLNDVAGLSLFYDFQNVRHNYSYFPVFINQKEYGMSRDSLYNKMKEHNILGRRYFYPLISSFSTYRGLDSSNPKNLPNANKLADSVICLPMHTELSDLDIERVTDIIRNK
jgi:dTDP-4-amino-4,6-dideoxygalactose transaminase